MTAASADLNTQRRNAGLVGYALASLAIVFAGSLVCLNAAGAAVPGSDTAGYRFVGVASDSYDQGEGDENAEVYTDGEFLLTGSGFAATDVGKPVYLIDDATVGLRTNAAVDHEIRVGTIVEYVSATQVWVRIEPVGKRPALGETRQYTIEVAGVNAAAFNLATEAAKFGGSDFYVSQVHTVRSIVTSTGAHSAPARKVVTTHWTLANGVISTVGDETANTWSITFQGYLT